MDLQLRKIVDTERFGQLPQKVWLAECTSVAYEPEIKQYFKQGSFHLESKQFWGLPPLKKKITHCSYMLKMGIPTAPGARCSNISPHAEGPSFLMPYPVWKATRRSNTTLPERHTTGKVMILGIKRASSHLITFNWVRPGFRTLMIQRWCHSKWSLSLLLFKVITSALVLFGFQWCSK